MLEGGGNGKAQSCLMKAFVSYAHDDHAAYDVVRRHLRPIERAYGIEIWADKRIKPGDYWTSTIDAAIEAACIHILLVSPSFFDSNYIFNYELPAINAKYSKGDLVLPVVISRCGWTPFIGPLQAAPMTGGGKLLPVDEWRPKNHGYDAVRQQLTTAIERHFDAKPKEMDWKQP